MVFALYYNLEKKLFKIPVIFTMNDDDLKFSIFRLVVCAMVTCKQGQFLKC